MTRMMPVRLHLRSVLPSSIVGADLVLFLFPQPLWDRWSSACCTSRRTTPCTAASSEPR